MQSYTDELRLRLAHEAAELGTWHWNAEDDSNVWDDQLLRIYGLTRETFDGSWDFWVETIHPDDRAEAITIVQAAMADCSSYVLRNRIVRPNGTVRWIEAHGKVLADEDGAPAGTIGCLRDVTERVELEQRMTAISDELQYSLAPSPLPDLDGFEAAAIYEPGGDVLEHVGGDWYDAVASGPGDLVLVVGDVMGRGVRAATTMIPVRAGIRGLLTVESAPHALLSAADEMVSRDAPDQFVTAAVVRLRAATRTLELCSAGHVPVVVVSPDGSTTLVGEGMGTPLGVPSASSRTTEQVALEPGSVVVLVTDGVVESREHDVDEGIERLRACAAALAVGSLEDLVRGVAALADDRLGDDVTVVAARVG